MTNSTVVCERLEDGIACLTLNSPKTRNALSDGGSVNSLLEWLGLLDADHSVRVIILTGAGTAFSAGGDLKTMVAGEGPISTKPDITRTNYRTGIQRLPIAFETLNVPVIAAVNGPAIGAGCDLACMCDLRIAAESAVFAESFVKLGLIPGDGGAWLLPRIVGFAKASEMALTGDRLNSSDALACGLVSQVVPGEKLIEAAVALARRIAANPPGAVRMTRRLLREAQSARLETVLELSSAMQALAHTTTEHKESLAAALRKVGKTDHK
ncbi:crotonase/enoyl-CoA hydratase family protein [Kineobactrum salinum]|uniref:Crotonase/enoyl-CoA hydratase family protein n=1 Tax=Kineobactrum salinum TaxID=2708301 RepID=A0A6C0TZ15_9GAMM|nr:crotonase/enoyl-CoA hydratase family protein [Kineobactrum salinum]QIB65062.1 crotonase/enoyl-CoA hydratase family protein [Kineobactrum salinum]